jgi:hypothetical protein
MRRVRPSFVAHLDFAGGHPAAAREVAMAMAEGLGILRPEVQKEMGRLLTQARAVVSTHVDWEGMCDGCLTYWARWAPYPCESARWASAVLESCDAPGRIGP